MVSAPAPPSSLLLPLLPVMMLASPLPVPLMLAVPVSVRFSTLAAKRVVGERRQHRVGAFVGVLRHHVADIVDDVGVVAEAADHRVGADAAVEPVVAAVAGERVGAAAADDVLDAGDDAKPVALPAPRLTVTDVVVPV